MRRLVLVPLLVACSHESPPPAAAASAKPSSVAGAPRTVDQGTFQLSISGKDVGTETFSIVDSPRGHELKSKTVLRFGERGFESEGVLNTDAAWKPQSATFKDKSGDATTAITLARRDDGVLAQKVVLPNAEPKDFVETQPSDLYLGDTSFSHLTAICAIAGNDNKDLSVFPGQPMQLGAKSSLPEALAGKRALTYIPFILGAKSGVEVICDGGKVVVARYPTVGLSIVRSGYEEVSAAIAKAASHKPDIPVGLAELPRKVTSSADGGATLGCSLLLPADRSATLPAVVFVTRSGPQDRDDDSPGGGGVKKALFKNIAIGLAQSGVASLRCDDRGVNESTGSLTKATLDTMVADTVAQVAALRAEPGIDPDRIAIIGHEEGSVVAPMVAEKDNQIKAVALLAAPGRTLDQIFLAQRDEANRQQGFKDTYVAQEHKRLAAIYAAIRAGKPLPSTTAAEERKVIEPALPWLASHFRHDPLKSLARLKIPIFAAQGGKDAQISVKEDTDRIRATLAHGNKRSVVKVYPQLTHVFAPAKTGGPADYSDPDLHVDPEFIGDLVTFLKGIL
jgi:uncharacterized protein